MTLLKLRLFPSPEQRPQVLATIQSVQGSIQVKPCCLAARVYDEVGYDGSILYIEEWTSELEFHEHLRSELFHRILAAMDMSQSEPEVCFYQVSAIQELELVHQLRNSPDSTGAGVQKAQTK